MKTVYAILFLLLLSSCGARGCDGCLGPNDSMVSHCTIACGMHGVRSVTYTTCTCNPPVEAVDAGVKQ